MSNVYSEFCKFGPKCRKLEPRTCSFAHSIDELRPLRCRRENCRDPTCAYWHFGLETTLEFSKRRGILPEPPVKKEKIKLCRSMRDGFPCKLPVCMFAHSLSEIVPVPCRSGSECVVPLCTYWHVGDVMGSYYGRFDPGYPLDDFVLAPVAQNRVPARSDDDFYGALILEEAAREKAQFPGLCFDVTSEVGSDADHSHGVECEL